MNEDVQEKLAIGFGQHPKPSEVLAKDTTPSAVPPTATEMQEAVLTFVGQRESRAARVTSDAILDGLERGCVRWYYVNYPSEYEYKGSRRVPVKYGRRLVIERVYLPVSQGITTTWNEWCVRWGLEPMQVFTPSQKEARLAAGLAIVYRDADDDMPIEPRHNPGAIGDTVSHAADDPEIEEAIAAASEEYNIDLEDDPMARAAAETFKSETVITQPPRPVRHDESKVTVEEAAELIRPKKPSREKKFWED